MKVETMFLNEKRMKLVRLSTYVANAKGLDICVNHCEEVGYGGSKSVDGVDMRCCYMCNANYLKPEAQEYVKATLGIEPTEHGYWGKDGCRLPRSHRPNLCIGTYCGGASQLLEAKYPGLMDRLDEAMWEQKAVAQPDGTYYPSKNSARVCQERGKDASAS